MATRDGRAPVPEALRQAVYDRDGRACWRCGRANRLTLDHICPVSLGGTDTSANLRTACFPCNRARGVTYTRTDRPRPPVVFACAGCNIWLRDGLDAPDCRYVYVHAWCARCHGLSESVAPLVDWVPSDIWRRGGSYADAWGGWFPEPEPGPAEIIAGWRAAGWT